MNIFNQLIKSLYSPKHISMFRFQGIGKTILYVFLLSLLSIIPTIIHFTTFTNEALNGVKTTLINDLPSFTISDGTLHSDSNEPIVLEKNHITIVFDSSGQVNTKDLSKYSDVVGILSKDFVIRSSDQEQSTPYTMLQGIHLNKNKILDFIKSAESMKFIFLPVAMFFLYLFTAGMTFIKITIFAFIGTILANSLLRNLPYRQSWRITAYSITLSTIFFAIMELLKTRIPGSALLDWLVTIIVLYLTIKEMPQKKTKK